MLTGLKNQKNNKVWGFSEWPGISADSTKDSPLETAIFQGIQSYPIELAMYNENDKKIGTATVNLVGQLYLTAGNKIQYDATQRLKVEFPDIPAEDLGNGTIIVRVEEIAGKPWAADNENLLKVEMKDAKSMPRVKSATISTRKQLITFAQKQIQEKQPKPAAPVKPKKPRKEISLKKFRMGVNGEYYTTGTFGAGVELGFGAFTMEGTFQNPMDDYNGGDRKDEQTGAIITIQDVEQALGANIGFSAVGRNAIFTFAFGATGYQYEDAESEYLWVPNAQLRLDIIPWRIGPAIRAGYMLEAGVSEMGPKYPGYFLNKEAIQANNLFFNHVFFVGMSLWI
jgi:hypothetical protein